MPVNAQSTHSQGRPVVRSNSALLTDALGLPLRGAHRAANRGR